MLMRYNRKGTDYLSNLDFIKELLRKTIDPDDIYVISCDFAQLKSNGENERIPQYIYEPLNPIAVILLTASVEQMVESVRRGDKKILDETLAELYLDNEETAAADYAESKNIPLYHYNVEDIDKAVEKVKKLAEVE